VCVAAHRTDGPGGSDPPIEKDRTPKLWSHDEQRIKQLLKAIQGMPAGSTDEEIRRCVTGATLLEVGIARRMAMGARS
jgi:hypothetical protein